MGSLGFYFNQESCIGCKTCQVACKDRNKLEIGELYRHVDSFEVGAYPDSMLYHYSQSCNHCEMPACLANCSTGAIQKIEDGTVQIDEALCNGCGACVESCPYSVPQMLESKGVAGKCDSCKPFRDAGKNPVCVDACVMRCLEFGDLDELKAKHGEGLVQDIAVLPSSETTGPNVLIKPKQAALEDDWRPVIL